MQATTFIRVISRLNLSTYPVIALFIFFTLFLLVTVYIFTVDKEKTKRWKNIPFEEKEMNTNR